MSVTVSESVAVFVYVTVSTTESVTQCCQLHLIHILGYTVILHVDIRRNCMVWGPVRYQGSTKVMRGISEGRPVSCEVGEYQCGPLWYFDEPDRDY